MKKVLLIAYYFPPVAATGAMRPLNFSRHLCSYGWTPSIFATDAASALPPQSSNLKLLETFPGDIEVDRIAHSNPRGFLLEYRAKLRQLLGEDRPTEKPGEPGVQVSTSREQRRPESYLSRMGRFLEEVLFEFPDLQKPWRRPAIRALRRRSTQDRPHVIWATGRPWTGLLIGKQLARQWEVPFIADFRDPWVAGQQHRTSEYCRSATILWRRAQVLERAVCDSAARVILNTEELREQFCVTYPEYSAKFVTITNGYPEDLVLRFEEARCAEERSPSRSGLVELAHFGTVYGGRSPLALFQAVEQLLADGQIEPSDLRLRFVGAWDVNDVHCERLAKVLEGKGILKREPVIPHRQCLNEMAKSDYLLILQAGFRLQIPAKIYEYMVANRPLLVIGGEGATENLVRRHNLGRCSPDRVLEIKQTLMAVLSDRSSVDTPATLETTRFSYRALTGKLATLFDAVCQEDRAGQSKVYSI